MENNISALSAPDDRKLSDLTAAEFEDLMVRATARALTVAHGAGERVDPAANNALRSLPKREDLNELRRRAEAAGFPGPVFSADLRNATFTVAL